MPVRGDRRPLTRVAAAALGLAMVVTGAAAQDGGLSAELRFSQRLVSSEGDLTGESLLGFGLSSETRNQVFEASLDGTYLTAIDSADDSGVIDPRFALSYGLQSRQTAVSLDLAYAEADVDSVFELDALPGIFVIDSGTRARTRLGLDLAFGQEAPFGGTLALGYSETRYSDTTDPGLLDEETGSVDLTLRFDIDRRISARVFAGYSETDRDGGTDVTRERLGAGADLPVTGTLDAALDLGLTRVTETTGGSDTVDEGLSFALALTEARPNGAYTATLSSDLDESGRRSTLTLGRSIELREASLTARFGLSEGTDGDLRPLYALSYDQALPRSQFGVSLDQAFATDTDGSETLNTRMSVDWAFELTRTSTLGAGLNLRDTEVLGASGDAQRLDLSLTYSHALTEDWSLIGGVTHTIEREDGSADIRSDEVFVGLRTSVGWRP